MASPTFRAIHSISNSCFRWLLGALFSASLLCLLSACASEETNDRQAGPESQVIQASYDEVWRATQKALSAYPIQLNNVDQGVIETDQLKAGQIFNLPYKTDKRTSSSFRYSIKVNVLRGKAEGLDTVRISVFKNIAQERDFFSGEKKLPSDGMEERLLLYRIEREIKLERSIKKAFERGKT